MRPADGGGDIVFRLSKSEAEELAPLTPATAVNFMVVQTTDGPDAGHLRKGLGADPDTF